MILGWVGKCCYRNRIYRFTQNKECEGTSTTGWSYTFTRSIMTFVKWTGLPRHNEYIVKHLPKSLGKMPFLHQNWSCLTNPPPHLELLHIMFMTYLTILQLSFDTTYQVDLRYRSDLQASKVDHMIPVAMPILCLKWHFFTDSKL